MSSLAELPELVGFFSYSREDDEAFKGTLSALRDGIQRELSAQLGRSKRTFRLWQDQVAIAPGKLWESEIKAAIDGSFFFIPIVTPRAVGSKYCKFEFEAFLAREKAIGRSDLVFPILYISVAALENEAKWRDDPVLSTIGRRQYLDWRPLRHLDVHTTAVREQIERLCQKIVEALNEPWTSPEERQRTEEAKARQQAEEEARRLEAEAKRRAEEEQHRKQAEAEARRRAEEERRRQKAEAKQRRTDEQERRKRAEAEARPGAEDEAEAKLRAFRERIPMWAAAIEPHKWWPISPAFLKAWQHIQTARVAAVVAALAVLLLIGWGGYAFFQYNRAALEQRYRLSVEQERQARATAEAEVRRISERAEQERQMLKGGAAEVRRISEQAEQERQIRQASAMDSTETLKQVEVPWHAGDFDRAIAMFSAALRITPRSPVAFNGRGLAYARSGDYDHAIADYTQAIAFASIYPSAFNNRGLAYSARGDYQRAIADYNEAIRLNPNFAHAFCNRGYAKLKINDTGGNADIAQARQLDASVCR